ncbi:MAG: c-type cytochrome [Rhodospirillaceae bacterium]
MALAVCVLLGACERAKRDMYDQPRYRPYRASPLFADGNSSRPSPPESVIHSAGNLAGTTSGRHGADDVLDAEAAQRAQAMPLPVTHELMERGRERYDIYCSPCHSIAGDGDGLVARRGFPHPPSYHIERLRKAPDRHFYDVISNGYGAMHSYADRVAPRDRWAIVAYIRALQLSQSAPMFALPDDVRARLAGSEGARR